jgi:hypothetical protein
MALYGGLVTRQRDRYLTPELRPAITPYSTHYKLNILWPISALGDPPFKVTFFFSICFFKLKNTSVFLK